MVLRPARGIGSGHRSARGPAALSVIIGVFRRHPCASRLVVCVAAPASPAAAWLPARPLVEFPNRAGLGQKVVFAACWCDLSLETCAHAKCLWQLERASQDAGRIFWGFGSAPKVTRQRPRSRSAQDFLLAKLSGSSVQAVRVLRSRAPWS